MTEKQPSEREQQALRYFQEAEAKFQAGDYDSAVAFADEAIRLSFFPSNPANSPI